MLTIDCIIPELSHVLVTIHCDTFVGLTLGVIITYYYSCSLLIVISNGLLGYAFVKDTEDIEGCNIWLSHFGMDLKVCANA